MSWWQYFSAALLDLVEKTNREDALARRPKARRQAFGEGFFSQPSACVVGCIGAEKGVYSTNNFFDWNAIVCRIANRMEFVLWACRTMHITSTVVWIGGLIFLNAVFSPIVEHEGASRLPVILGTQKRFLPFIWSSVWTLLITGFLLMLFSPRFRWFDYSTVWAQLLAVKQLAFVLLAFFSWQTTKVFSRMETAAASGSDEFEGWRLGFRKLVRRAILWGIIALMCAAGMMVV